MAIKYALININVDNYSEFPHLSVLNTYDDIVTSNKARDAYFSVYPKANPQNIQIVQFSEDEIPF